MKVSAILFLFITFVTTGCYYDNEEDLYHITPVDCSQVNSSFNQVISNLISTKCSTNGCHNASAAGGVTLLTYSQINDKAARIKQRAIIDKTMPPGGGLTTAEINSLSCWISSGSPQN